MPSDRVLKIVLLGPPSSGKSVFANFLTDQVDLTKVPYNPTKGVRILETDVKEILQENSSSVPKNFAVQLWDMGGDKSNQQYWNALIYNADAAVIVYNADRAGQEKDLETLLYFFNQRPESAILKAIPESRILVLAHHHKSLSRSKFGQTSCLPPEFLTKVKEIHTSLADNSDEIRVDFQQFVNNVHKEVAASE